MGIIATSRCTIDSLLQTQADILLSVRGKSFARVPATSDRLRLPRLQAIAATPHPFPDHRTLLTFHAFRTPRNVKRWVAGALRRKPPFRQAFDPGRVTR